MKKKYDDGGFTKATSPEELSSLSSKKFSFMDMLRNATASYLNNNSVEKDVFTGAEIGLTGADAILSKLRESQERNNFNRSMLDMNTPQTYVDNNMYGDNRNNSNLSVSDTAITRKGGEIHIKPENRGKFNATKARTGKTTEELIHSSNPITRKRAIFAQNAAKWHHEDGGNVSNIGGPSTPPYVAKDWKDYNYRVKMYNDSSTLANFSDNNFWKKKAEVIKNINYYNDNSPLITDIGNLLNGRETKLSYGEITKPLDVFDKAREYNYINNDIKPILRISLGDIDKIPDYYVGRGIFSFLNDKKSGTFNPTKVENALINSIDWVNKYKHPTQIVLPPVNTSKLPVAKTKNTFVPNSETIKKQKLIGVTPDGIWGPKSEEAWKKYTELGNVDENTYHKISDIYNKSNINTENNAKINPIGTLKIAGREIPYNSEIELNELQNSFSKYGKIQDVGDYSKTKTKFFKGEDFKGWDKEGNLLDKKGNIVYSPIKNNTVSHKYGGYVEGKEYDLSPEQIKELQKQGYELEILK